MFNCSNKPIWSQRIHFYVSNKIINSSKRYIFYI